MSDPGTVEVCYDALEQVAGRFGSAAEASASLRTKVTRDSEPLAEGGWIGLGATAFFAELHGEIFPALQRLELMLTDARAVTLELVELFRRAEEEAAAPFRGGVAAGGSAGGTPAPGGAAGGGPAMTPVGPSTSGPFRLGPPQRPPIKQDSGFLDQFPPREPGVGDRLNLLKWRAMLEGSEALRPDLVDANAAYRHFLDDNGGDRQFSYERYIQDDPSGQVTFNNLIVDAQSHAETLGQGRDQFSMTSDAYALGGEGNTRFPYPESENWQKTIGAHHAWTSSDVQVSGSGADRTYTMTMTVHVEDRYNFNPDSNDIATGIPDSANGDFEVTGLANQYTNRSTVTRTVTWREGDAAHAQIADTELGRERRPQDNRRARNRL